MTHIASIESVLAELKGHDKILDATVVSRSGMHISGEVPKGTHLETYVAMSAILLGAAETATLELKEQLNNVSVEMKDSKLIIFSCGPKALLVARVSVYIDTEVLNTLVKSAKRIEEFL